MTGVELHLALNHIPVVGLLFCLVLILIGISKRDFSLLTISLYFLVAIALITIIVYLSGESAEEVAEKIPGVKKSSIDAHEDVALFALIFIELLGIASLFSLFFLKRHGGIKNGLLVFVLLLAILSLVFSGLTSRYGGKIRHPEIEKGFRIDPVQEGD